MTKYLVLEGYGDGGYTLLGHTEAFGPERAIREVARDATGIFVAVPARNWTELERRLVERAPTFVTEERAPKAAPKVHPDQVSLIGERTEREATEDEAA